ncbi:hypothetical protein [Microbacterium sp. NPDC091662]|uniref:hypothetical protein n=1 Tax=Microbacterium sp. NPDC091662 TaxID=3364211 RepID=UPI003822F3C7
MSVLTGWFELPGETGLLVPADRRGLLGNSYSKAPAEIRPVFNGDVPANVWEWDERLSLRRKDAR